MDCSLVAIDNIKDIRGELATISKFHEQEQEQKEEVVIIGEYRNPDLILSQGYQKFIRRSIRKNKNNCKLFQKCRVDMNNLSQDIDLFKLFKKARLNLRKRTCITTIYLKTWIYELPDNPQLIHGIYLTKD